MSVGLHTMTDDALAPKIRSGDQLFIFKAGIVELDLEEGDVVSIHRDDEMILRRVVRLNKDAVWIQEDGGEKPLLRKEISGKVVHVIHASDSLNR